MARVIYRWQVASSNFEAFRDAWRRATNRIHESVAGAKGSFMLRSAEDSGEVLTIAKWDSIDEWKEFWGNNDNPEAMEEMRRLAKRISVEAFEDIEDHTR